MSTVGNPVVLAPTRTRTARIAVCDVRNSPAAPALEHLGRVLAADLGCRLVSRPVDSRGAQDGAVIAVCPPFDAVARRWLRRAGLALTPEGTLSALATGPYADQGFVAGRVRQAGREHLVLAAASPHGLRHALITLGDRLFRDATGAVVVDPFDGVHRPAFAARHLKTDAMNAGPFRARLEYWDPTSATGVDAFADWLAAFRITDYDLLAFVRGWGLTYASERFPALVDPQHPNPAAGFYPRLIDRLHAWGVRVWGADVYLASGYGMEVGTCPEMLSPGSQRKRLRPFRAGRGSFADTLHDPQAVPCLSHPAAAKYYAAVVDDILECNPGLDGLDFHIGHMFPGKICRCAQCRDLAGNRDGVLRGFRAAYAAAIARNPHLRLKAAFKMFGDATRRIVESHGEFPQLEFFCWLRWLGNLIIEDTDAPVLTGHEDGGGGLEANHDPKKTLAMIRDYYRDYEPWLATYVRLTRDGARLLPGHLTSFSWEPALHREIEHEFFLYSQLTWEPDLSWTEFARRYVIRSERRLDPALAEAYRLALEANAAATFWGLKPDEYGCAQRVVQMPGLLAADAVREKVHALTAAVRDLGLDTNRHEPGPARFDLRWSLAQRAARLQAGRTLGLWH